MMQVKYIKNIFNAEKSVNDHVKKSITSSVFLNKIIFCLAVSRKII